MDKLHSFFMWFTDMGNSKMTAAVLFFVTFVLILIYVFTSKERKERFDDYRFIPFLDDEYKTLDEAKTAMKYKKESDAE